MEKQLTISAPIKFSHSLSESKPSSLHIEGAASCSTLGGKRDLIHKYDFVISDDVFFVSHVPVKVIIFENNCESDDGLIDASLWEKAIWKQDEGLHFIRISLNFPKQLFKAISGYTNQSDMLLNLKFTVTTHSDDSIHDRPDLDISLDKESISVSPKTKAIMSITDANLVARKECYEIIPSYFKFDLNPKYLPDKVRYKADFLQVLYDNADRHIVLNNIHQYEWWNIYYEITKLQDHLQSFCTNDNHLIGAKWLTFYNSRKNLSSPDPLNTYGIVEHVGKYLQMNSWLHTREIDLDLLCALLYQTIWSNQYAYIEPEEQRKNASPIWKIFPKRVFWFLLCLIPIGMFELLELENVNEVYLLLLILYSLWGRPDTVNVENELKLHSQFDVYRNCLGDVEKDIPHSIKMAYKEYLKVSGKVTSFSNRNGTDELIRELFNRLINNNYDENKPKAQVSLVSSWYYDVHF